MWACMLKLQNVLKRSGLRVVEQKNWQAQGPHGAFAVWFFQPKLGTDGTRTADTWVRGPRPLFRRPPKAHATPRTTLSTPGKHASGS